MTLDDFDEIALTRQQRAAVDSDERAIVVLANAGSGKTETVARRVLRLLENSDGSSRVLALTYTNKAADELRTRFRLRAGDLSDLVDTETLHGFAHALVQQHGTRIGLPLEPELLTRDEDRVELLTRWLASQGLPPKDDAVGFFRQVDLGRARLEVSEEINDWRQALTSLPGIDYAGLLDAAHELLELNSVKRQVVRTYTHIIVDEAQNLSPAQYRLLEDMVGVEKDAPSAMLVGDDKQSIVSFAGADPALLQRFMRQHNAQVVRLDENFRSARVLRALSDAVARDLGHRSIPAQAHAAPGSLAYAALPDESTEGSHVADWVATLLREGLPTSAVAPGEMTSLRDIEVAVLARSATALRGVAASLEERGISYTASSSTADWLEGTIGQVVMEIVALRASPDRVSTRWRLARLLHASETELESVDSVRQTLMTHDDAALASAASLLDAVNVEEFIGRLDEVTIPENAGVSDQAAWLADASELRLAWSDFATVTDQDARSWSNFRRFCSHRQRGASLDGVQLLTIHKAQGREFKAVAIVGMNDGQIPDFRARTVADQDAERRTFYVAVTRARRLLLLTRSMRRRTRFGSRAADPSPFLNYLPQD